MNRERIQFQPAAADRPLSWKDRAQIQTKAAGKTKEAALIKRLTTDQLRREMGKPA